MTSIFAFGIWHNTLFSLGHLAFKFILCYYKLLQSNFNASDSNTDGSYIMADSNSFLSSQEILLIVQVNKYLIFRDI